MKTFLSLLLLMTVNFGAMAQHTYTVTKDSVDGGLIFNGPLTTDDLANETSFDWFEKGEKEYVPDDRNLKMLQFYLQQYDMVVFLGTWCDDSHNIIPKLAKVLVKTKYPSSKLAMYGVDREKKNTGGEYRRYKITNVPTIIVMKNGKEIGRITESVHTTVEGDLAAILQQDMEATGTPR